MSALRALADRGLKPALHRVGDHKSIRCRPALRQLGWGGGEAEGWLATAVALVFLNAVQLGISMDIPSWTVPSHPCPTGQPQSSTRDRCALTKQFAPASPREPSSGRRGISRT